MASKRPALPKASEEMRRWSVLLLEEVQRWPDTRVGSMFGLISVYRGDTIFALLPGTRAFELSNGIATKPSQAGNAEGKKWKSFTIDSDKELGASLERLHTAYQAAKTSNKQTTAAQRKSG